MIVIVSLLVIALAAANGANDVSKGVATLAGAGVTRYRTAIIWGAAMTLAGGVLSVVTGRAMGKLFSSGIIGSHPVTAFALAALAGTLAWVAFASIVRLPVSTTHALVGSLIGAGLLFAPSAIQWHGLLTKVVTPLLLSILVAYGFSAILGMAGQAWRHWRRTRPSARQAQAAEDPELLPGPAGTPDSGQLATTTTTAATGVAAGTTQKADGTVLGDRVLAGLHWMSSGAACLSRALNDTPKIAAVGAFALLPEGLTAAEVTLMVAVAMGVGSLLGIRVAKTLGERVVRMGHLEGFRANAITALLVGFGAQAGWPMSTTHVSTGAISGIPGTNVQRLNSKVLRDFIIAWTVTPVCGGLVAAVVYLLAR